MTRKEAKAECRRLAEEHSADDPRRAMWRDVGGPYGAR